MQTTKQFVTLDFETASDCDLKKCGATVYAQHPTTEILVLGYSVGGMPAVWIGPWEIAAKCEPLYTLACDPKVVFVCHNAGFERMIWKYIMGPQFGWPDMIIERWHDTMAVSFMKGLPGKLEVLARVLALKSQKDMAGNKFTLSLSKPNKKTGMLDRSPEAYARAGSYVVSDVDTENEVLDRVRGFAGSERAVWDLDQRINDRGIKIDREYVQAGIDIINQVVPVVSERFRDLVGCKPTQRDQFVNWLQTQGTIWPKDNEGNRKTTLKKETVDKLLGDDADEPPEENLSDQDWELGDDFGLYVPPICKDALRMRAQVNSASVKKLPRMLGVIASDGRAHQLMQYHGAGPGRWAGRLLQPHNFPRSVGFAHDTDDLVSAILRRDVAYLRAVYGDPLAAISGGLRHALVAEGSKEFHLGDYTQIEARVVLALAGATKGIEAFVRGKPYVDMAEAIYHRKVDKHANVAEYTIGKNTILGCGFQMGWRTFRKRYCPLETDDFAKEAIRVYREDFAPEVPDLWYGLERAAIDCVWEKRATEAYGCQFRLEGEWLTILLPSGRKLWYYDPRPVRKAVPWDETDLRPSWTSLCVKMGKVIRRQMYGGLITENVVQGLARDILVEAMFRAESAGLWIVLTVHDEIVDESTQSFKVLEQCMTEKSQWLTSLGVPINIEGITTKRYKK